VGGDKEKKHIRKFNDFKFEEFKRPPLLPPPNDVSLRNYYTESSGRVGTTIAIYLYVELDGSLIVEIEFGKIVVHVRSYFFRFVMCSA
jgi:hypothetical protein